MTNVTLGESESYRHLTIRWDFFVLPYTPRIFIFRGLAHQVRLIKMLAYNLCHDEWFCYHPPKKDSVPDSQSTGQPQQPSGSIIC